MKYAYLSLLFCILAVTGKTQVVNELKRVGARKTIGLDSNGWKHTGLLVLNINQSAQQNWGTGGESFQLGINAILNKVIHHRKGKYSFDGYFDVELGLVEASSFKQFRKTNDRCDLTAELEHRIGKKEKFNYGLLCNFNTQLFPGHSYLTDDHPKISSLMSPGKILLSLGVDYKHKNANHYFSAFLTPATVRWVTKLDPDFYTQKRYGVDSFRKVYTEIGAYLSLHYNSKFNKTTNLISRLDLFSNYKRKPENVDILWNNVLSFGITRYLAGTFLFDLIYDHDFKRRTQIQEITGLGLRLKL